MTTYFIGSETSAPLPPLPAQLAGQKRFEPSRCGGLLKSFETKKLAARRARDGSPTLPRIGSGGCGREVFQDSAGEAEGQGQGDSDADGSGVNGIGCGLLGATIDHFCFLKVTKTELEGRCPVRCRRERLKGKKPGQAGQYPRGKIPLPDMKLNQVVARSARCLAMAAKPISPFG